MVCDLGGASIAGRSDTWAYSEDSKARYLPEVLEEEDFEEAEEDDLGDGEEEGYEVQSDVLMRDAGTRRDCPSFGGHTCYSQGQFDPFTAGSSGAGPSTFPGSSTGDYQMLF